MPGTAPIQAELGRLRAAKLSARELAALGVHYGSGYSEREIADAWGVSRSAVHTFLARGRVKLQRAGLDIRAILLDPPRPRVVLLGDAVNSL